MTENFETPKNIYEPYIRVWIVLLVLTGLTVLASFLHLGKLGIWISLTIASLKGGLVAYFFMHLKDEQLLLKAMFLGAIFLLAIFISLTLFDTAFR